MFYTYSNVQHRSMGKIFIYYKFIGVFVHILPPRNSGHLDEYCFKFYQKKPMFQFGVYSDLLEMSVYAHSYRSCYIKRLKYVTTIA